MYNMENFKRGYLPIEIGVSLKRINCPKTFEEREHMNKVPYASAVGAIMYVMTCTHPHLACSMRLKNITDWVLCMWEIVGE
jgi:hypothetical protein